MCFDRDLSVSTNPPDESLAVPLSWVKYLAHERTDCDLVASGNQHLKREAAIPGMEEMKTAWMSLNPDATLPYPSKADRYDESGEHRHFKPTRRDGLRLVRDVYESAFPESIDAITFIVVDDVDLSDVDGFNYYFPETFVYAVVSGHVFGFSSSVPVSDVPVLAKGCPEPYEMSMQSLSGMI